MLLALDTGTATGVAIGRIGEQPVLSTLRLPEGGRADVGRFFSTFEEKLTHLVELTRPSLIVFEAPFIGGALAKNMHSARRVIGLPCVVEMVAHRAGVECAEAVIFDVRGFLLGKRGAKKHAVWPEIAARGLAPTNDHEADAAAVWLYAASVRANVQDGA